MSVTRNTFWTRTLSVTTIALASIALAGCSLLGGLTSNSGTAVEGDGQDTDVFSIAVGDCLNDGTAEGEVSTVPKVDCAEPHDSEAYESIILADGEFPGDDAIAQQAVDGCKAAFDSFIGLAYDDSVLDFSYYYPTDATWAQGDREILCLAIDPAGKVTGSLEGAAR